MPDSLGVKGSSWISYPLDERLHIPTHLESKKDEFPK
jgi:hypothetical protein